jgi:CRISPR-associated protein Cas2
MLKDMFVSVLLDPGSMDTSKKLSALLLRYGFERMQRACWESSSVTEEICVSLRRDIDRITDYYDSVRIYQYPVHGVFTITILNKKRWRRVILKPSQESPHEGTHQGQE